MSLGKRLERYRNAAVARWSVLHPQAADLTITTLQAQVELLQAQLQAARQREAWLQGIIEQRLLPPPRQGIIERIAEAIARLRQPKGNP